MLVFSNKTKDTKDWLMSCTQVCLHSCSVHTQEIFWNFKCTHCPLSCPCFDNFARIQFICWKSLSDFKYLSYLNDNMFTPEKPKDCSTIINLLNCFQPSVAKVKSCLRGHIINYVWYCSPPPNSQLRCVKALMVKQVC